MKFCVGLTGSNSLLECKTVVQNQLSVYRWIIEMMKLFGMWGFETTNPGQCLCFDSFVDALYLWKEL